jgi:hypothetical protein
MNRVKTTVEVEASQVKMGPIPSGAIPFAQQFRVDLAVHT